MSDVIVGEGFPGVSFKNIFKTNEFHISENENSFYSPNLYLGFTLIILKNTNDGKALSYLLNDVTESSENDIYSFMLHTLLENVNKDKLIKAIDLFGKNKFNDGKIAKLVEIHNVLSLPIK